MKSREEISEAIEIIHDQSLSAEEKVQFLYDLEWDLEDIVELLLGMGYVLIKKAPKP